VSRIINNLKNFLRGTVNYIEGNVVYDSSSIIENSSLIGDIEINEEANIYSSVLKGNITVGRFTSINGPNTSIISAVYGVKIGAFCSIAKDVLIQEYNHKHNMISTAFVNKKIFNKSFKNDICSKGPVVIGHDVWVGAGSIILSGVKIGNGAIIGANSTVTKDIPAYSVVGGSPARVIDYRFSETVIERIGQLEWWNWSLEKLKNNIELFQNEISDELSLIEK